MRVSAIAVVAWLAVASGIPAQAQGNPGAAQWGGIIVTVPSAVERERWEYRQRQREHARQPSQMEIEQRRYRERQRRIRREERRR